MSLFSYEQPTTGSILAVLFIGLIVSGCSALSGNLQDSKTTFSSWTPGDEWTVEVTYWPDRLQDPYAEGSSRIQERWTYRVLDNDNPTNATGYRVRVRQDTTAFLLRFSDDRVLLSVDRIRERRPNHLKLQRIHSSPTANRVFLAPGWKPDRSIFWAHPYPTLVEGTREYNLVRGGRSVQGRLTQRVRKENGRYRFEVRNNSGDQRATFLWSSDVSWWDEARYFNQGRLILRAVRIDP